MHRIFFINFENMVKSQIPTNMGFSGANYSINCPFANSCISVNRSPGLQEFICFMTKIKASE